jgi:hypothetical protein
MYRSYPALASAGADFGRRLRNRMAGPGVYEKWRDKMIKLNYSMSINFKVLIIPFLLWC